MLSTKLPAVFLSPEGEPRYYWSLCKLDSSNIARGVSLFSKKTAQMKCYSETVERICLQYLTNVFSSAVGNTYSFAKKQCLYEAIERAVNSNMKKVKKVYSSLSRKVFVSTKLTKLYDDCKSHNIQLFLYQTITPVGVYHITCKAEFHIRAPFPNILFGSKCHVSLRKAIVGSIEEVISRIPWARKHLNNSKALNMQERISNEEREVLNSNTSVKLKELQEMFLNDEVIDIAEPILKPLTFRAVQEFVLDFKLINKRKRQFRQNTVQINLKKKPLFFSYIY